MSVAKKRTPESEKSKASQELWKKIQRTFKQISDSFDVPDRLSFLESDAQRLLDAEPPIITKNKYGEGRAKNQRRDDAKTLKYLIAKVREYVESDNIQEAVNFAMRVERNYFAMRWTQCERLVERLALDYFDWRDIVVRDDGTEPVKALKYIGSKENIDVYSLGIEVFGLKGSKEQLKTLLSQVRKLLKHHHSAFTLTRQSKGEVLVARQLAKKPKT